VSAASLGRWGRSRAWQVAVECICDEIRASPYVGADETGWRQDGCNGYLWTVTTPTARYYTFGSRAKGMVDAVLGETFSGVVISDCYAANDHYPGVQQKC
jgi:hypothetical protein